MDWTVVMFAAAVVAFFALIAWLRSDADGELPSPGEPGDADRFPRFDG